MEILVTCMSFSKNIKYVSDHTRASAAQSVLSIRSWVPWGVHNNKLLIFVAVNVMAVDLGGLL